MIKTFICLLCYVIVAVFPAVSGQNGVCDNDFASIERAFRTDKMNMRTKNVMLHIAHGNKRTSKCRFLRRILSNSQQSNTACAQWVNSACPARRQRAFAAAASRIHINPKDCAAKKRNIQCDRTSLYRTIDGSCNNLQNPEWGQANSQQRRYLKYNAYDDGKGSPKTKACNGNRILPNPRTVSTKIHSAGPDIKFEPYLSYLLMQIGQFFAHDCMLTEQVARDDGSPLSCCGEDRIHAGCNPITIPHNDTFFTPHSCMDFARSKFENDCSSVRQMINTATSWIDLSAVYASTESEAKHLRSMVDGKLKEVKTKLPVDTTESTCILTMPFHPETYYCPFAGDIRVIEQPGLATIHTIFMREHNRIAAGLKIVNPHWNDERLYQEARRINNAQWQHVIYSEFVPTLLGSQVVKKHGLQVPKYGYNDKYDPKVDGTVSLTFSTAVFRYGHSQVHNNIGTASASNRQLIDINPLEDHFFKVGMYHGGKGAGLDSIVHWTTSTKCPFTDGKFQDSIRQKLFSDMHGSSFDLITLNIHRGRDHGLPGYTAYRRLCGLSAVTNFGQGVGGLKDHDPNVALDLKNTYGCVEGIDLFTGMMTEKRTSGGVLGPTWQCLMALEFKRLRNGDRFFYDREDKRTGFSLYQLNSIKTVTTSTIICHNTDAQNMQPNAYLIPNINHGGRVINRLTPCSNYKGVDLRLWKELPTTQRPDQYTQNRQDRRGRRGRRGRRTRRRQRNRSHLRQRPIGGY